MNCRQARREMHELLHAAGKDRTRLDQHLGHCGACRAELARLEQLDTALRDALRWEPEDAALDRVTRAVLDTIARSPEPTPQGPAMWPRLAAAIGVLVAVFASGLFAGRVLLPREVVVTRIVEKPEVVERVVKVPFETIRERVVTREVPVVKTRIVNRGHPVPQPVNQLAAPVRQRASQPVKAAEVTLPIQAVSFAYRPPITYELTPVTLVSEVGPEEAHLGPANEALAESRDGPGNREPGAGPPPDRVAVAVDQPAPADRAVAHLPQ